MPMFIKMGLGGAGYLGKQSSYSRAASRRAARRKANPGFPIMHPFESIDDVRKYRSGDKITCLLCGKSYRSLGIHLKRIHDVGIDDYKERYKIPWTYSLACAETREINAELLKKRIEDGSFEQNAKTGDEHKKMISAKKRRCPFKEEVGKQNLPGPVHPLTVAPDGSLETFSQRKLRLSAKRGTPEFQKKMRSRQQCQSEAVKERGFNKYWVGKKQSEEHIAKRFKKNGKGER